MRIKLLYIVFAIITYLSYFGSELWACTPLQQLKKGNERYVNNTLEHPNRSLERREATSFTQEPFAIILGCSDSRVSPEIIFDQGIGDLFIIRVAGNCLGDLGRESLLFGVLALHAKLIVILGHDQCGAIQAVLSGNTAGFPALEEHIKPAIKNATTLHEAVQSNVLYVEKEIKELPLLKELLESGQLQVKGAIYDLRTGAVSFL